MFIVIAQAAFSSMASVIACIQPLIFSSAW
jgi:hypothetical protein